MMNENRATQEGNNNVDSNQSLFQQFLVALDKFQKTSTYTSNPTNGLTTTQLENSVEETITQTITPEIADNNPGVAQSEGKVESTSSSNHIPVAVEEDDLVINFDNDITSLSEKEAPVPPELKGKLHLRTIYHARYDFVNETRISRTYSLSKHRLSICDSFLRPAPHF
jgi:hypothetical protein